MSDLVKFRTDDGAELIVEVNDDEWGVERVARDDDGVLKAGTRLEQVLATARPAIKSMVDSIRELAPDGHEIEFGIKLNAEAGAIVAKTSVEGHFTVRLQWHRPPAAS